jgi:hypothetical protein
MERIGHSSPAAALRYQHVMKDRDKAIAAGLDRLAQAADILTATITTTTPPTVVARNGTTAAQAHRPGEAGPLSCGNWSGRPDLNRRPPAPKAGALTKLRHVPCVPPLTCEDATLRLGGRLAQRSLRICFDLRACPSEPQERRWQRLA